MQLFSHAQNITFESSFFALGMNAGRRSFTMNDGEEDQSAQVRGTFSHVIIASFLIETHGCQ